MKPKKFKLSPDQIRRLIPDMGGCIASDRITVDGKRVGTMAREVTNRSDDSGWVFLAGDESRSYRKDLKNFTAYHVNTLANYDPDVIPYLYALPGQVFDRDPQTGGFTEAADSRPDESAARLPPGISVVQGRVRISDDWSIELPTPFRRRHEDGSLVLWRPALTFWIAVREDGGGSISARLNALRADVSPSAFDPRTSEGNGLALFSYRLNTDTTDAEVPSLNVLIVGARAHLRLGVYADRSGEIAAARAIIESVRNDST